MNIQIEPHHLAIVKKAFLKIPNPIYIFGSRAKGTARELSDLDIAIKGKVDKILLSQIKDELEESHLPFKVDIILWDDIDANFKSHIEKDLVDL